MIPILFSKNETQFISNGIGRLTECMSCEVTEERNGIYECEFIYPITGKWYNYIIENGGIIYTTHDDTKRPQPFDIYKYSAPINGIVTFNARHISYRLLSITVEPFTASSCLTALEGIGTHSMQPNPFGFWTDKSVATSFTLPAPASARSILAGNQGSILDVYGKGEYEFDKFTVKLHLNRGINSGVSIRYGKNLNEITNIIDEGQVYNAVAPFWKGDDGTLVMLPEKYIVATGTTGDLCVPLDLSTEFEDAPSVFLLRERAEKYLNDNTPWIPDNNITIDFIQLWQTDEYKDYAPLQKVSLCDTVSIYYPALNVSNASAKVIRVVYDSLREKYVKMELGKPQTTLQSVILKPIEKSLSEVEALAMQRVSNAELEAAIQAATQLITGVDGGHVVLETDSNGEPQEILIMDTDNKQTAVNVWRWNLNGLGHSHSGYAGPYNDIALTMDGKINASMILTGYLVANIIKGGTLSLGGAGNANGIWIVNDAYGNEIARGDKDGVTSKALTATDYIFLNGGAGSYLNIPLKASDPTDNYLRISSDPVVPFVIRSKNPDNPSKIHTVYFTPNPAALVIAEVGTYNETSLTPYRITISKDPDGYCILDPDKILFVDDNGNEGFRADIGEGFKFIDSNGEQWFYVNKQNGLCIEKQGKKIEIGNDGEINIYKDTNGTLSLFARIGNANGTGEPEFRLVGQSGTGDIYLSPGVGLQIGNTTLSESQLQQLLALI